MTQKKLVQRRWLRTIAIVFGVLFSIILSIDIYIRNMPVPECADGSQEAIKCPFIAISKPSMESRSAFVDDVEKFGMEQSMAQFVAIQVGWQQNGLWSVLKGDAPDIYALDQVRGVTHCDVFVKYLDDVATKLKAVEVDGQVTQQDLVAVKKWIAEQEGLETISESSKIETSLIFVYAGGNMETTKVYTEDILLVIQSKMPTRGGTMSLEQLDAARALTNWD